MSSDKEMPDILSKLSSSDVFEKIDDHLPEIITLLESDMCSAHFGSVLQILMKDGFKYFDLESIQRVFLRDILNVTLKIFNDCLESIKFNLETESAGSPTDVEFSLSQLLKVGLDVLDGYGSLLGVLSSLDSPVDVGLLDSVPQIVITVTGLAFIHCRDSESNYGRYFAHCSNQLTNLFRKSFEVETSLMKVLDEKFNFKGHSDEDMSLLLLALDKVMEIGDIVCGFELSAVVDQWKGFVKIVSKHHETLLSRLNLGPAFVTLTSNLLKILHDLSLYQVESREDTSQWLNRYLKLGNFVLKVVIKLCELYSGYLSNESSKLLLQLLINLYGYDQMALADGEFSRMFKSYLTVGASPLLSHLISELSFISEYRKMCSDDGYLKDLSSVNKLGCYSFTVSLSKKLIKSQSHVQHLWLDHELISSLITVIALCGVKTRKAVILVDDTEAHSTLVCCTALLMTSYLDPDSFQKIETVLFQSFFYSNLFVKLYLEDLFCLLARLANEAVVLSWLEWLGSQRNSMMKSGVVKYHPQLVHILALEYRLVTFLSPKARKLLPLHNLPANSLHHLIDEVTPQSTHLHFNSIVDCLDRLEETSGETIPQETDAALLALWCCIRDTRLISTCSTDVGNETAQKSSLWWSRLLNALCKATCSLVPHLHNLDHIFEVMLRLSNVPESFSQLSLASVMKSLAQNLPLIDLAVGSAVSFKSCLILFKFIEGSSDPLIKITSLEILELLNRSEHFCHQILDKALCDNSFLSSVISNYFNGDLIDGKLIKCEDNSSHISNSGLFVHKCSGIVVHLISEPPAKKPKVSLPCDINELLAKNKLLYKEIVKHLDEGNLSTSQKSMLEDLITLYQGLQSYI